MAKEYAHLALHPSIEKEQAKELLAAQCRQRLDDELKRRGKSFADLGDERKGAPWKIAIARILRQDCQATNVWLATFLKMGHPRAVSSYLRSVPQKYDL